MMGSEIGTDLLGTSRDCFFCREVEIIFEL